MDILVYAKPEVVEHKMADKLKKNTYCYWTGRKPAKRNDDKIKNIYFSNGQRIYAEGKFIIISQYPQSKVAFWFHPLRRINKLQPRKPPTRGWCYINIEK